MRHRTRGVGRCLRLQFRMHVLCELCAGRAGVGLPELFWGVAAPPATHLPEHVKESDRAHMNCSDSQRVYRVARRVDVG